MNGPLRSIALRSERALLDGALDESVVSLPCALDTGNVHWFISEVRSAELIPISSLILALEPF
jgi:hypothetical protein